MMRKDYLQPEIKLLELTEDTIRTSMTQDDCFGEDNKPNGWEGLEW